MNVSTGITIVMLKSLYLSITLKTFLFSSKKNAKPIHISIFLLFLKLALFLISFSDLFLVSLFFSLYLLFL